MSWLYTFIGGGIIILIIRAIQNKRQHPIQHPIQNASSPVDIFPGEHVDIRFDVTGSSFRVLSNWAQYEFEFDGYLCRSMESLLQAFKFSDTQIQREVLRLTGDAAAQKAVKSGMDNRWKEDGLLFWNGLSFQRNGEEYHELLNRAYCAKMTYNDNHVYRVLRSTRGISFSANSDGTFVGTEKKLVITCSELSNDPAEAVITEKEFCDILMTIRDTPQ